MQQKLLNDSSQNISCIKEKFEKIKTIYELKKPTKRKASNLIGDEIPELGAPVKKKKIAKEKLDSAIIINNDEEQKDQILDNDVNDVEMENKEINAVSDKEQIHGKTSKSELKSKNLSSSDKKSKNDKVFYFSLNLLFFFNYEF